MKRIICTTATSEQLKFRNEHRRTAVSFAVIAVVLTR